MPHGHFFFSFFLRMLCVLQVEQTFGAKPLASLAPHLLSQYRECLEACMEEADLEDYFSRGIGVSPSSCFFFGRKNVFVLSGSVKARPPSCCSCWHDLCFPVVCRAFISFKFRVGFTFFI